jgi:hypothetical protein
VSAVRVARMPGRKGGSSSLVVGPSVSELEAADMALLYVGTAERCTFLELQACAHLMP